MNRLRAKLKKSQGESLVEVLAAILVATLSVALLLGGVVISTQLGRQADQADQAFYQALSAAENRQVPLTPMDGIAASPQVTITNGSDSVELPVQVYGGENLYSYGLAGGGEP